MMPLKKKQPNPNPADDRQERVKIKVAINEIETKKTTKNQWLQGWYTEKSKDNRFLTQPTKGKKKETQINKIRDKHRNMTTDNKEVQNILREYFKNLYSV